MPRNVRNFWLELSVDGSKSRVETGPRAKDGGFELSILMRDNGSIIRAFEVRGFERDGNLTLIAEPGRDVLGPFEQGQMITIKRPR